MLTYIKDILGGRASRKNTVRSIAWNYVGYLYNIAITFGLTSYLVRRIPVGEYGLFLFVMSLSGVLYLLDMGISNVLVQAYVAAAESSDKARFSNLMGSVFIALLALGGLGVLIFSGIALTLPGPFNIPRQYLHEAAIIFFISALVIQVGLPSNAMEHAYQASHRFDRLNQIQLLLTTVQMVLYVSVLAAGYRIVALALVLLGMSALRLFLLIAALPGSVPGARLNIFRFSWISFKPLIQLSKWAFLNNIGTYLFDLFVWIILGSFGSMKEAAMFGLASKAPKQLWNLVDKGTNVMLPILSRSFARRNLANLQRSYIRTQKLVFGAILPFIVLGCCFARPMIEVWAGEQYAEAAVVMQWLLIAAFSHAMSYPSDQLLYAGGEVKEATEDILVERHNERHWRSSAGLSFWRCRSGSWNGVGAAAHQLHLVYGSGLQTL